MDLFLFIFLIVLVGCASGVANEWLKRRPPAAKKDADPGLAREVQALKARIETLERIITDRRYGLERELDALDEERPRAAG